MNHWNKIDFKDAPLEIIDGDRGKKYPKQNDFFNEGFCLFISAKNVTKSGFVFSECQFITEQKDHELRKGKLQRGDVVVTTRGTIGNVAYYKPSVPFENIRINSGMVIMRCDLESLLPHFLYYFLRSNLFLRQVNSFRSGVAQPQLPIRDLHRIKVSLPDIHYQKAIADILSAYDDLIENNQRRMKLLEESARLLYREWFVHLRFPGHEHTKIIDGVPERWEKKPLVENVVLNYGKSLKADERIDGQYNVYGSSGIVGTHEEPLAKGPGIIIGRKGNVGSVYWSPKDFFAIDTVYFVNGEICNLYLYYALKYMNFISTDVAVPGLNRGFAYSLPLITPSSFVIRDFLEKVSPLHLQIEQLNKINKKLREARDLLLPRLMSGEITV